MDSTSAAKFSTAVNFDTDSQPRIYHNSLTDNDKPPLRLAHIATDQFLQSRLTKLASMRAATQAVPRLHQISETEPNKTTADVELALGRLLQDSGAMDRKIALIQAAQSPHVAKTMTIDAVLALTLKQDINRLKSCLKIAPNQAGSIANTAIERLCPQSQINEILLIVKALPWKPNSHIQIQLLRLLTTKLANSKPNVETTYTFKAHLNDHALSKLADALVVFGDHIGCLNAAKHIIGRDLANHHITRVATDAIRARNNIAVQLSAKAIMSADHPPKRKHHSASLTRKINTLIDACSKLGDYQSARSFAAAHPNSEHRDQALLQITMHITAFKKQLLAENTATLQTQDPAATASQPLNTHSDSVAGLENTSTCQDKQCATAPNVHRSSNSINSAQQLARVLKQCLDRAHFEPAIEFALAYPNIAIRLEGLTHIAAVATSQNLPGYFELAINSMQPHISGDQALHNTVKRLNDPVDIAVGFEISKQIHGTQLRDASLDIVAQNSVVHQKWDLLENVLAHMSATPSTPDYQRQLDAGRAPG